MKKTFYLTNLLVIFFFIASCSSVSEEPLFDTKGNLVNKGLEKLLKITGQSHDGTLDSIISETQNKETGWIRSGERWDKQKERFTPEHLQEIVTFSKKLGYLEEKVPSKKQYDRALVLGAASVRIKSRLNYLIDLWKRGIRFDKIVMLGSTRTLDTPESDALLKPIVIEKGYEANEKGLMEYIYNHEVNIPEGMKSVPVIWVKAEGKCGKRANTNDTIEEWLKQDIDLSKGMAVLSISNQPHASYQGAVIDTYLVKYKKGFNLTSDIVGEKSSLGDKETLDNQEVSILLDAAARHLYSLKKLYMARNISG